jgi:aminoglycoside phosphotransferase family enzyme
MQSLAIQHKGASMPGEQDQSATVAFLQAQGDGVERIDTHGAMIFLAGDQVFKLKRAVDLGYLNFASLAARGCLPRRIDAQPADRARSLS